MLGRHIRSIIKESLDDLDWIRSSESDFDPNFEFKDFEYWVDISKLNREENELVFDYIKEVVPDYPKNSHTASSFKTLAHYKGIVIHCGNEDNDYYPEKNHICFLSDTWEQDPHKDYSIYVDGREVLEYIKSTEEDEDLDESLNWSDNDTASWDKDKNFSTDPTFITDPNWASSPEKSYWVQGSTGGSSESGEDVNESEEDWGWLENTQIHPNYKGHPQGVVYLYDHDEIDEFCDIIENYNGGVLPRGDARGNLHQGLEHTRDELESSDYDPSNAVISASFFVERKEPGLLSVGYWGYEVDERDISSWLHYGDTFNKDYHQYSNLDQVRKVFEDYQNPELIKESDFDINWIKEIDLSPTWGELLKMNREYGFLKSGDIIKLRGELTHGMDSIRPRYFDDVIIRFVRYDYKSPIINHVGPEEVNEWLDIDDTEDEFYMTGDDEENMVVTNFEELTKGKTLKESKEEDSDWDWVKEVPDTVPFELAEIGKTYRIEVEDELLHALEACGEYDDIFTRSIYATVESKREMPHSSIFCDSGNDNDVLGLHLGFLDSDEDYIDIFWVTQEMLNLYEI